MSAGTIIKKIQTLEETIQSLRQQLVFSRTEEEEEKELKQNKQPIQPTKTTKQTRQPTKAKQPKATVEEKEKDDKIPMPWTGVAGFTTCVGLKAQYGLFIQCGKACNTSSASFLIDNHECRFCNDCSKKCDENGKHSVGTIEERIESGVGKYVNAKTGKKEMMYIEVLEKMGITKEQALESAQKRGFQIPDWMLEKAEKKRGRPSSVTTAKGADKPHDEIILNHQTEDKPDIPEPEIVTNTKEKKQRQPRAKTTTKATTTKATTTKTTTKATTKKTASVATKDTPEKKDSVQSSICIDLNECDGDSAAAAKEVMTATTFTAPSVAPKEQETQEKKKRGRPSKSNTQNNVGESEMQQLIIQATAEKKKRLSIDPSEIQCMQDAEDNKEETQPCLSNPSNENEENDDEMFELFDKILENENDTVATATKTVETTKMTKTKKEAAAAAAAAATEEEEDEDEEEDEELECEEYEYDGEIYGLAPNGDIYSQDGNLVGKLTNGVPKMSN